MTLGSATAQTIEASNDDSQLHFVSGILRQSIGEVRKPTEYYTASEIGLSYSGNLVPHVLCKRLPLVIVQ
jgi:hypothetical protein